MHYIRSRIPRIGSCFVIRGAQIHASVASYCATRTAPPQCVKSCGWHRRSILRVIPWRPPIRARRLRSRAAITLAHHFGDGADDDPFVISSRLDSSRRDENAAQRVWFDCTPHPYGDPALGGTAPAQADHQANCVASVDATRAEWRNLSHSSVLKPSDHIATGDGRWLAGSQLNYAHILIGRGDNACGAGNAEEPRGYVDQANKLLNPTPSGIMLATRPGN